MATISNGGRRHTHVEETKHIIIIVVGFTAAALLGPIVVLLLRQEWGIRHLLVDMECMGIGVAILWTAHLIAIIRIGPRVTHRQKAACYLRIAFFCTVVVAAVAHLSSSYAAALSCSAIATLGLCSLLSGADYLRRQWIADHDPLFAARS